MRRSFPYQGIWILSIIIPLAFAVAACDGRPASDADIGSLEIAGDCSRCKRIETTLLVNISDSTDALGNFSEIAEDNDGRMFLIHNFSGPQVSVYDHAGKLIAKIGRQGRGPGEFMNPFRVAAELDSVWIYDSRTRKASVFDETLRYQREFSVPLALWRWTFLSDQRIVASGTKSATDVGTAPFHVLSSAGAVQQSFPTTATNIPIHEQHMMRRPIRRASDTTFWAAHPQRYTVELWSVSGLKLASVARAVDWFPPVEVKSQFRPDTAPTPVIRDIWIAGDDQLWVLSHVADARWREQFLPDRPVDMSFNGDLASYLDSVVEVIDVRRGRVVASRRFDEYISCISQHGHLGMYSEVNDVPHIELWTATVQ